MKLGGLRLDILGGGIVLLTTGSEKLILREKETKRRGMKGYECIDKGNGAAGTSF